MTAKVNGVSAGGDSSCGGAPKAWEIDDMTQKNRRRDLLTFAATLRINPHRPDEFSEHSIRIKIAFGQLARGGAMLVIVPNNLFRAIHRLLERTKGDESSTRAMVAAESGLLHERGASRGEITDRAVADPTAVRAHIN